MPTRLFRLALLSLFVAGATSTHAQAPVEQRVGVDLAQRVITAYTGASRHPSEGPATQCSITTVALVPDPDGRAEHAKLTAIFAVRYGAGSGVTYSIALGIAVERDTAATTVLPEQAYVRGLDDGPPAVWPTDDGLKRADIVRFSRWFDDAARGVYRSITKRSGLVIGYRVTAERDVTEVPIDLTVLRIDTSGADPVSVRGPRTLEAFQQCALELLERTKEKK